MTGSHLIENVIPLDSSGETQYFPPKLVNADFLAGGFPPFIRLALKNVHIDTFQVDSRTFLPLSLPTALAS